VTSSNNEALGLAWHCDEERLGHSLTQRHSDAVTGICGQGRAVSLVLGVAGSGKTTALGAVADAYEACGFRVIGTATAGQAARTLGREAGLAESRTLASLRWRLTRGDLVLDRRTVVVVDEAGMTADPDLLAVLAAGAVAGSKVVLVGDDRQLSAVGPGGALGALLDRHDSLVHRLDENVRQVDPAERSALDQLRSGEVTRAVEWYAANGRIRTAPDRDDAIRSAVDAWAVDVAAGRDALLVAWRRDSVQRLNEAARRAWSELGRLAGPELEVPGGRRYAAGDLIVTLAPASDSSLVTSQRGMVTAVDPKARVLTVRMDDRAVHVLRGEDLGADRLAHSYALTVHRSQGATVDTCHRLADGGGRELAYVAMSRARTRSVVHTVADNLGQAVADLVRDWGHDRRPCWAIDTGTPKTRPEMAIQAQVVRQVGESIEVARSRHRSDLRIGRPAPAPEPMIGGDSYLNTRSRGRGL
jgi:ATP-dependent exoDNAse (exonuclease V) alpha subunit